MLSNHSVSFPLKLRFTTESTGGDQLSGLTQTHVCSYKKFTDT